MVTRTRIALGPAFADLADDTEESVLGSSFHQDAIVDTYVSLKLYRRKHDLPWFIGNQTKLVIPRAVGPSYQPSPDLLVHPTLGCLGRSSLPVALYGSPTLVIEGMSPATAFGNDLSETGKLGAYAASGVTEYLAFDLFGDFIPELVRAWRLGPAGTYVPWERDGAGRWASSLGIAFAPQDSRLRVYDEAGKIISSYEDLEDLAEERERQLEEAAQERAEQARQLLAAAQQRIEQERQIAELQETLRRLRGEA